MSLPPALQMTDCFCCNFNEPGVECITQTDKTAKADFCNYLRVLEGSFENGFLKHIVEESTKSTECMCKSYMGYKNMLLFTYSDILNQFFSFCIQKAEMITGEKMLLN